MKEPMNGVAKYGSWDETLVLQWITTEEVVLELISEENGNFQDWKSVLKSWDNKLIFDSKR